MLVGLGLELPTGKRKACPARVAEAGQGNIETVHEPKPIQAAGTLMMDQGRRAMEGTYSPQAHVHEGTYAIKVSMKKIRYALGAFIRNVLNARTMLVLCMVVGPLPLVMMATALQKYPVPTQIKVLVAPTDTFRIQQELLFYCILAIMDI